MNKIEFTPFEERLYALAGSTRDIDRYKKSAGTTAVLFSVLFAATVFILGRGPHPMSFSWPFAAVLAVYAVLSCLAISNFHRSMKTYRSILRKIEERLADRTGEEGCREKIRVLETSHPEIPVRNSMYLLTAFFLCILFACAILPLPGKNICAAASLIFFLLLEAVIKCRMANLVKGYKKVCMEEGTRLRKLTWPDAK